MPGPLTCFTSNANTNSQLEALKFNYRGQLDPGEGLTLRIRRKRNTPFSSKLSGTKEMDSSQILFIRLKVSQILLCQAWLAKQPNSGLQPAVHTLGAAPDPQCLTISMLFWRELSPATWLTHILGVIHGSGTGGHRHLATRPDPGLAATARTHQHHGWSILQPTTGLQQACRWQISCFLLEMKFNLTKIIVFVFPTGSNQA